MTRTKKVTAEEIAELAKVADEHTHVLGLTAHRMEQAGIDYTPTLEDITRFVFLSETAAQMARIMLCRTRMDEQQRALEAEYRARAAG